MPSEMTFTRYWEQVRCYLFLPRLLLHFYVLVYLTTR
jgi:hypothetical protein